jgi:hypothetical protein
MIKEESVRKLLEQKSRAETPTLKNVKENLFSKYDVQYRGITNKVHTNEPKV